MAKMQHDSIYTQVQKVYTTIYTASNHKPLPILKHHKQSYRHICVQYKKDGQMIYPGEHIISL